METKIGLKDVKIIELEILTEPKGQYPVGSKGYKVQYPDNEYDWIPEQIIDKYYYNVDDVPFGIAFEYCKRGNKIRATNWVKHIYANFIQSKLYISSQFGKAVWRPTVSEIMFNHWQILGK